MLLNKRAIQIENHEINYKKMVKLITGVIFLNKNKKGV
jgi:hypothetical protein